MLGPFCFLLNIFVYKFKITYYVWLLDCPMLFCLFGPSSGYLQLLAIKNLLWNVRHSSVQTTAFKRSFLKIIISCLPIQFTFQVQVKKYFVLLFCSVCFSFFTLFTKRTKPVTESWCQTNFVRRNIYSKCFFLHLVFLHWYIYLKDN